MGLNQMQSVAWACGYARLSVSWHEHWLVEADDSGLLVCLLYTLQHWLLVSAEASVAVLAVALTAHET